MTIEEYLDYQAPEGMDDELIQGVIVLSPSASPRHASVCTRLYDLLRERLPGSEFVVRLDVSMRLEESVSMPRPDVFVMDAERWEAAESADKYPVASPQLAIEVFSPSNVTKEFRLKPGLYLAGGASAVWVVRPKSRTIEVHDAKGLRIFSVGEEIALPTPLPAGTIPVEDVFAKLRLY